MLGGTFDPIHIAHLRLAEELADGIGLSRVRFIPTGAPPHRGAPRVTGAHRMEMVRLAIAGSARFEADDREIRRQGVCYTFDTLNELRAELGDRPLEIDHLILGIEQVAPGPQPVHLLAQIDRLVGLAIEAELSTARVQFDADFPFALAKASKAGNQ